MCKNEGKRLSIDEMRPLATAANEIAKCQPTFASITLIHPLVDPI